MLGQRRSLSSSPTETASWFGPVLIWQRSLSYPSCGSWGPCGAHSIAQKKPPPGSRWLRLGSGLVAVAIGLVAVLFWPIAVFRVDEGLDPEIGRLVIDLGNYAFVTFWVVIASFVLAVGLAALRTGALPRWLWWASVVLAAGLLAARVAWTSQASFTPYVLFWIWLFVTGVILIRRARRGGAASAG